MSTWTYDITDNIGKVRLMIGDTDIVPTTDAHFSDEEIQVFLTMASSSVYLAAAMALEAWAATETANLDSEKIGDYMFTRGAVNKKLTLAKQYRSAEEETPVFEWSEPDYTSGSAITTTED